MNIGQVLEIHLSLAAKALGFNIATPVFDGAKAVSYTHLDVYKRQEVLQILQDTHITQRD